MLARNGRRRRILLLATSIAMVPFDLSLAKVAHMAARCSAMKMRAEGRELTAELRCHARAKRRGTKVDAACLGQASMALDTAFARAGSSCDGSVRGATTRLVEWTNTLLNDIAGGGRCPAAEIAATRRAFARLAVVTADPSGRKAAKRAPSTKRALCHAFRRAGDCGVSCDIVFGHVTDCWSDLVAEVGAPTTSTTTTLSPASSTIFTSSSTTSTLPPPPAPSTCRLPRDPVAGIACGIDTRGSTYYVDAGSGDDSADGTAPTRAWATLEHAFAGVPSGSSVLVAAGTYTTAELVIDRPVVMKGGYDATFGTWDPDRNPTVFTGRLTLADDAAVFGGFQMVARPAGRGGGTAWGDLHHVSAGTLIRNRIDIDYTASTDQHWFYAITASAAAFHASRLLCNDMHIQSHAAPGGFLATDAIEFGNLAAHTGTAEVSLNRICLDDHANGWVSTVIDGYGSCGDQPANIAVTNNVIENAVASEPSAAVEFYGCSHDLDLVFTNNTLVSAGSGLVGYANPPGVVRWKVTNNIIAGTGTRGNGIDVGTGAVEIASSEDNLIFGFANGRIQPAPRHEEGNRVTQDSLASVFVAADAGDFHLLPASPAAAAGLNVFGIPAYGNVTADLDLRARPATGAWDCGALAR